MGLLHPDVVQVANEAYRNDNDEVATFITDCRVVAEGTRVEPGQLFCEDQNQCQEQGILEPHWLRLRTFRVRIRDRFGDATASNSKRYYHGIGLRTP